jgi:hypothetical protein
MSEETKIPDGSEQLPTKPQAVVKNLWDLTPPDPNDGKTLLGHRFLCRGSGMVVVGSSGIGKSTAVMQMCIWWAAGRSCFGIQPNGPLKIVMVQSENDEGDLCEMRDGIDGHLKLPKAEQISARENFHVVFESSRTAQELADETIEPALKKYKPDLLVLDPALSYLGGDANKQEVVGGFLRNILTPLLQKYNCGALIVHHTAKPSAMRGSAPKVATDFAYAATGSAEWANWPRAVLVLGAKDDSGLRELRIGKRFRLGWKDAEGKPCASRLLRQNSEGGALYYTEVSAEEAMVLNGKLSPLQKVLQSGILPLPGEEISKNVLIAQISGKGICGIEKARKEVVELLISEGHVVEFEKPRSGARGEKWLRRVAKTGPSISFASRVTPPKELVTDELQMAPAAVCN